ncbi:hypothetical protein [Microbacterium sp. 3J1]|uniref:hypothetical protein n=1 Tax=Microbacterium sp. 3J1 TaxID=861269 RepID=UPI000B164A44|nr:hypothetical protein [Microbacterium sp. 3J1]
MVKRIRWLLVAVLLVAVTVVISVLVVSFPARKEGAARIEAEAGLPLVLTPEASGQGSGKGEMILKSDGVAELTEFPIGEIDAADGCTSLTGMRTFSGRAEWTADRNLNITISSQEGAVIIGPYNPTMGDVVWYRFGMPVCGSDEVIWYLAQAGRS